MDGVGSVISSGSMSTLVLEAIKKLIRVIMKNPQFDFNAMFYLVMIPILNFAMLPVLALMGFPGYTMPVDWQGWIRTLVQVIVASLISAGGYNMVVSPFKAAFSGKAQG
jgi:hypothetical protein